MAPILWLPVKLFGWAAVGAALAAGWKLGSYLLEAAMGDESACSVSRRSKEKEAGKEEPLWKRRFSKVSGD